MPMGRIFSHRLAKATRGVRRPHHRIRLGVPLLEDLWSEEKLCQDVLVYAVVAGLVGFGVIYHDQWCAELWPENWVKYHWTKNLTLLDFFPLVVAVAIWGEQLRNSRICFWTDNKSVVHVVNHLSSSFIPVIKLIQLLVLKCLHLNIWFRSKHVSGINNAMADSLSRFDFQKFRDLALEASQHGTPCPDYLWEALKGWKNLSENQFVRRPISFSLLARLVDSTKSVCSSVFESVLLSAAFGIAFFGALRVSELVAPSLQKPGGLQHNDISFCDGGIRIRIQRSKTDTSGNGVWFPLFSITGPVCPINLVKQYLAVRTISQPFFVHFDGSPLTRFQFLALFRQLFVFLNLPLGEYGTHSFRICAATEAARAGLMDDEIMKIGKWCSSCFFLYIRPDLLMS
ncbi:unnamed protein product [Ranitomeya imitator]|uniref:Tyr recombinase domain-containing protein n=1 Tax=Ranitomeya imitator TaxID=111125 RepID=A0ABN9LQP8_9NEOB|nr:unnamed protein product [Ranitomeya imitator]